MQNQTPPLKFEPLSTGLGFHPPIDSEPKNLPGLASLRPPSELKPPAKTNPPFVPVQSLRPTVAPPPIPTVQRIVPSPVDLAKEKPPSIEFQPGLFYLARRVLAFVVDFTVGISLAVFTLALGLKSFHLGWNVLWETRVFLLTLLFSLVFSWSFLVSQEVLMGTSIGKKLFRMELGGDPGQILLRAILFIPSVFLCGLGLIWVLFDSESRAWHDLASGTHPHDIP